MSTSTCFIELLYCERLLPALQFYIFKEAKQKHWETETLTVHKVMSSFPS